MGKSRKLGWCGYVDSHEAILETIGELEVLKMLPPIKMEEMKAESIHYRGYSA